MGCFEAIRQLNVFWKIIIERILNITKLQKSNSLRHVSKNKIMTVSISDLSARTCECQPQMASTYALVKIKDMWCDTCNFEMIKGDNFLEDINRQNTEIINLRKENLFLKRQIENLCSRCKMDSSFDDENENNVITVPAAATLKGDSMKLVDSEMLITIKKTKDEDYEHVSILQVLHKTNAPLLNELNLSSTYFKRENPLNILVKVQNALEDIVNREIEITTSKREGDESDITASFQTFNRSRNTLFNSSVTSSCIK